MDELIRQLRQASSSGLYYLALFGALALPDVCGALASDDGNASGPKYKAWLRDNVPEQANQADLIWGLRCSLLHQGRAFPRGSHYPIAFVAPAPHGVQFHNLVTDMTDIGGGPIYWCSIPIFVEEVTGGAERWLRQFGTTNTVTRNLEKFARLRPEGLLPHVAVPVIA